MKIRKRVRIIVIKHMSKKLKKYRVHRKRKIKLNKKKRKLALKKNKNKKLKVQKLSVINLFQS